MLYISANWNGSGVNILLSSPLLFVVRYDATLPIFMTTITSSVFYTHKKLRAFTNCKYYDILNWSITVQNFSIFFSENLYTQLLFRVPSLLYFSCIEYFTSTRKFRSNSVKEFSSAKFFFSHNSQIVSHILTSTNGRF